jgi:L-ascorbate metabolism protein UlaG (beta-lactamase superfamily)
MQIKWFGQSAFLLTSETGTRILIDPYDKLIRYRMPVQIESDIVVVTHNHGDHNKIHVATGDYMLVNEPMEYHRDDVSIQGIKTYHDKVNGKKRGDNIVFKFLIDDLTVCHCGDLGHLLTESQISDIGHVDILMIPVGGKMTLNGADAAEVMNQLHPSIAIPMHYRTKALSLPGMILFDKVDKFIEASRKRKTDVKILDVTPENLSQYSGVVTMQYE